MYNWWRQRKHKKQTKDETHLHMAWEEDYHMQDPGRLALFDEYLEMSIASFDFVFEKQKIDLTSLVISIAVWICNSVRCCISVGAIFRVAQ